MPRRTHLNVAQNVLIGAAAILCGAGVRFVPARQANGPVLTAAVTFMSGKHTASDSAASAPVVGAAGSRASDIVTAEVTTALGALASVVHPLSHPQALPDAFRSYFAYKAAHPDAVTKPYLYFVDYGLPSTTPRGYLFDMQALRVVEGPFTVAHGRGSSAAQYGIPSRFSDAPGSAATSLGLYLAQQTYAFLGRAGGQVYHSIGLRLMGVSDGFNENAYARRVVAHGAPYVTPTRAGRSEGCPAVEPARAERLLPKLANGGMVFLFAPDSAWMAGDPWITAGAG